MLNKWNGSMEAFQAPKFWPLGHSSNRIISHQTGLGMEAHTEKILRTQRRVFLIVLEDRTKAILHSSHPPHGGSKIVWLLEGQCGVLKATSRNGF